MSAKPETTFYNAVNRHVDSGIYRMKNNNPYIGGIPDIWYSGRLDLWVEYKFIARVPSRAVVKPYELLSALQLKWLNERFDEGRSLAVIIGCPEGGIVLTDKEWMNDIQPSEFVNRIKTKKELGQWITGRIS